MSIIVFGSINMDLVVRTARIPLPGETLSSSVFETTPGGKGANQAVACARLGAPTAMLGCVGDDGFGVALLASLAANGVAVDQVEQVADVSSGIALITVDAAGANTIVVVAGANEQVGGTALASLDATLKPGDVLLLQLEIPLSAVMAAAKLGYERGATVILDPAPARALPPELYPYLTIITPNQTEAGILVGDTIDTLAAAETATQQLLARGVAQVIIKLGADGIFYADAHGSQHLPTFAVTVVDTVGAGDAFNGGLAAGIHSGLPLIEALRWGLASGALCVTKRGAQIAMPSRAELLALLARP
ncbi:MAG: ribokinase [Armatimonadetes bacterium]|nr:ribokinase [Anaerolineae bacterium]